MKSPLTSNEVEGVEQRLVQLRQEIAHHDVLYYGQARPEITDAQYDDLFAELERLEREHPELVTPDSPTLRVSGAPAKAFLQVRHNPPMRSLDKTYDRGDLYQFDQFLHTQLPGAVWDYIVEPKVDGLSLSLIYTNGLLTRAATRGNGEIGDDITANVRTIRSIPLRLPIDLPLVEVRGEIYMTREGFATLNRREEEAGHEPFANPRNAAAGSIKLLDPREVARRPLDAVLYAAGSLKGITFNTHSEMMRTFASWGLKTSPWQKLCMTIDDVMGALDELEALRHAFPFEMDGAVIKINQRSLYASLGSTAHAPRSARAYKYAPEHIETTVEAITIQVGRTGVLTPVAELKPVFLAGSTIARATLHNEDFVAMKDIRVGDTVWLAKAGDVIPAIESVVPEKRPELSEPFAMPKACPVCGAPVVRLENEVARRCTNPECPAQRIGRLEHFVSRNALDIRAIGGRLAECLVEAGCVVDPLDLFILKGDELAAFPIAGEDGAIRKFGKKADDVLASLSDARKLPLHRWLFALGIPSIGVSAAKAVAGCYAKLSVLFTSPAVTQLVRYYDLSEVKRASVPDYNLICGEMGLLGDELVAAGVSTKQAGETLPPVYTSEIKPEMARAVAKFVTSDYGQRFYKRMQELGIDPEAAALSPSDGALAGLTFVITGTLNQPRTALEELIAAHGGTVLSSVSKKTRYLIVGADPGGSKYTKAQQLGTPMLSEAALLAMLPETESDDADSSVVEPPAPAIPESLPPPPPPTANAEGYVQDSLF